MSEEQDESREASQDDKSPDKKPERNIPKKIYVPPEAREPRPGASGEDESEDKPKKRIPWWVWVLGVVVIVLVLVYWLIFVRGYENTDDAYTDGYAVPIAAKVSGYVRALPIRDNLRVKAGDLLLAIEPADYQIAAANADAQIAQAKAQLDAAKLDLEINRTSQRSTLESAKAARAQAKAQLDNAIANLKRQTSVDPLATTQQQTDQIAAQAVVQRQTLRDAEAKVRTAEMAPQNIATYETKVAQAEAQLKSAYVQLDQAKLNLGYTAITAPLDGFVTERNVEIGSYVQAGQSLMNMVGLEVWITANFKENQLAHMRVQQPVTLKVDAFPDLKLHGHVDSFQQGSGSRFSAFPAQNATGNFVKIVQRVPVKIVIDSGLDPNRPLPLGLSVVPTVDVR